MKNESKDIEANFYYASVNERSTISGFVNWDKAGRHFRLEECQTLSGESDCFTWSELDSRQW